MTDPEVEVVMETPTEPSNVPAVANQSVVPLHSIDVLQRRYSALEMLKTVGLKVISKTSVVDMDGKPYIDSNAMEAIGRIAGVIYNFTQPVKQMGSDSRGAFYTYFVYGTVTVGTETIPEMGTCSSRDKFFGVKDGDYRHVEDIDESNIVKKAIANFKARGIKTLLGFDGLTWNDLQRYDSTLTPENCGKVKFATTRDTTTVHGDGLTLPQMRSYIGHMLMEMNGGEQKAAEDALEAMTSFEGKNGPVRGRRSAKELSDRQTPITYGKVKDQYKRSFGADFVPPQEKKENGDGTGRSNGPGGPDSGRD